MNCILREFMWIRKPVDFDLRVNHQAVLELKSASCVGWVILC